MIACATFTNEDINVFLDQGSPTIFNENGDTVIDDNQPGHHFEILSLCEGIRPKILAKHVRKVDGNGARQSVDKGNCRKDYFRRFQSLKNR
jgi:hypothetical protein